MDLCNSMAVHATCWGLGLPVVSLFLLTINFRMVRITSDELGEYIRRSQQGRRMPYLCALNRAMGWRILPEGVTEMTKDLRTHCMELPSGDGYITSMAASERNGILAVGSAQRRNKDEDTYTIYFLVDRIAAADDYSVYPPRFEVLHEQVVDIPVHSLDWCGSHLLVGSKNGITALYSVHDDDPNAFRVAKVTQYTIPFNRKNFDVAVPGKFPFNSIVKAVEFAPDYSSEHVHEDWQPLSALVPKSADAKDDEVSSRFLSTFYNTVHVWDALSESSPQASFTVSNSLQTCASWSPHQPRSLIVTGGCDNSLQIIDTRADKVVWEARDAHARPIRDAKFNNFIPYWVASAGEDCVVNIFDIRAIHHAPVAKIDGHNSVVQSIAWSNMRPENIATASRDGTMRMWMLTSTSIAAVDAQYNTAKWTNYDTLPTSLRDQSKVYWSRDNREMQAPWMQADEHHYYDEREDPWGHSDELEATTMLLPGAVGLGEWGAFDEGPVYIGEDFEKSRGPVVSVKMSKSRLSEYYCATHRGQITVQACRLEKRDNLDYQFKFDKETDPVPYEIEYNIYVRQITRAQKLLAELRETVYEDDPEKEEHRKYTLKYFEARMAERPEISPIEWSIDSIPNLNENKRSSRRLWNKDDLWNAAISAYQKDLDYYSRRLPPGMRTRYNLPLDSTLHVPKEELPVSSESVANTRISLTDQTPPVTPGIESFQSAESTKDGEHLLPSPTSGSATSSVDISRSMSEPFATKHSPSRPGSDGTLKQNRFLSRSKTLKRMFSRRSNNSKEQDTNTEQQQPAVVEPPWQLRRSQTSRRRNALLGT